MTTGRHPLLPVASLVEALKERYGDDVTVQPGPPGLKVDSYLYVTLPHERLTITTFVEGTSVSLESGDDEVTDALAWYRSLLPADFPRVIAFDPGWNGHVELPAGVRGRDIAAGWVDHSVEGWNADDPDLS